MRLKPPLAKVEKTSVGKPRPKYHGDFPPLFTTFRGLKGKPWRVTNCGWPGSSWRSQRAPGARLGSGGVDLLPPTPATRRWYPFS
jgi:hypothetical protein